MFAVPPALADPAGGLPAPVRHVVDASVAAWSATGNAGATTKAIADLCATNPGIAPDIVSYAGEAAARADEERQCAAAGQNCDTLDLLLAQLYEQALRVSGRDAGGAGGVSSGGGAGTTPPGGGIKPIPPCVASGTCGEQPPTSATRL